MSRAKYPSPFMRDNTPSVFEHILTTIAKAENKHFVFNDGGRKAAGFNGSSGDCAVRAIAIAEGRDYRQVYNELYELNKELTHWLIARARRKMKRAPSKMSRKDLAYFNLGKKYTGALMPQSGIFKRVINNYLKEQGWQWTPTMFIGKGCQVHLLAAELPRGVLLVSVSKHIVCVIDGVIHDTGDPSRGGTRCVYGFWQKI